MRKVIPVGWLEKDDVFYRGDQKWVVSKNLGSCGVAVRKYVEKLVTIEGKKPFTAHETDTVVWTASAPVEVEVRG